MYLEPLIGFRGLVLYVFCPPFLWGTEGLKGEVMVVSCFGENFTSQMKIALFVWSFALFRSEKFIQYQAFQGVVGQGRLSP